MTYLEDKFVDWLGHVFGNRQLPQVPIVLELLKVTFYAGARSYQEAAKHPKVRANADAELSSLEKKIKDEVKNDQPS